MEKQIFDRFQSSLLRCLSNPHFLDAFYEAFFASSPEVARAFAHTDMDRQKAMLNASLYQLMTYYETQDDEALRHVRELGATHGKHGHDIRPPLYDLWLESLVRAVKQSDPYFDTEIEAVWRDVMSAGIDVMKSTYAAKPQAFWQPPAEGGGGVATEQDLRELAELLSQRSQEAIRRYNAERNPEAAAFQFGQYRAYLHASEVVRKMLERIVPYDDAGEDA